MRIKKYEENYDHFIQKILKKPQKPTDIEPP